MCPYKIGEQTTDRILYDCELVEQERDKLKAEILRSENWLVSRDTLINKYTKSFKKFVDSIPLEIKKKNLDSILLGKLQSIK